MGGIMLPNLIVTKRLGKKKTSGKLGKKKGSGKRKKKSKDLEEIEEQLGKKRKHRKRGTMIYGYINREKDLQNLEKKLDKE